MGRFAKLKELSIRLGLYRPARWFCRHILSRGELRTFRNERSFYRQFIRPGDLVFDIGANVGFKTEVFLALGARVVSFEPQSECHRELVARCHGCRGFTPVRAAVGAEPGRADLHVHRYGPMSSLIAEWGSDTVRVESVPVTTLTEAIRDYGQPSFCKIDVEGFEYEVVKNLSVPIRLVSFEYHRTPADLAKMNECIRHLARLGPVRLNVTPGDVSQLMFSDWLAPDIFLERFYAEVVDSSGQDYGDVFVEFVN
jgi:FkbM family methyltransferase